MAVLNIHQLRQTDDCLFVEALIEDAVLVHHATMIDPPEFGPGVCSASLVVDPDEDYTTWDESDIIQFLEDSYVDWEPMSASDFYVGTEYIPF
jgi:hypothetical protein